MAPMPVSLPRWRPPPPLVPTIVLQEVYRWAERERGESAANRAMLAMQEGSVVPLDADLAIAAARLARRHKLPTADSIIYATAQACGATVWTQDDDLGKAARLN